MNAIIFHGTECKPEDFWYQGLQTKLQERGYQVSLPYYKDMNRTPIAKFLPKVLADAKIDEDTVLVGHSAGAPLILAILQQSQVKIKQAVLVAGFYKQLSPDGAREVILQESYDWEKIKANAQEFTIINSDNDPWGCDDAEGRAMYDQLGGTLVIRHDGHFGSISKNQPYKEFPLLERLIGVEA